MTTNGNIAEQFSAYLDGELSEADAARLAELLRQRDDLAAELRALRATRDLVRGLPRERAPEDLLDRIMAQAERGRLVGGTQDEPQRRPFAWVRYVAVAAVLLVAVGVGTVVYMTIEATEDGRRHIAEGGRPVLKAPEAPVAKEADRAEGGREGLLAANSGARASGGTGMEDGGLRAKDARGGAGDGPGTAMKTDGQGLVGKGAGPEADHDGGWVYHENGVSEEHRFAETLAMGANLNIDAVNLPLGRRDIERVLAANGIRPATSYMAKASQPAVQPRANFYYTNTDGRQVWIYAEVSPDQLPKLKRDLWAVQAGQFMLADLAYQAKGAPPSVPEKVADDKRAEAGGREVELAKAGLELGLPAAAMAKPDARGRPPVVGGVGAPAAGEERPGEAATQGSVSTPAAPAAAPADGAASPEALNEGPPAEAAPAPVAARMPAKQHDAAAEATPGEPDTTMSRALDEVGRDRQMQQRSAPSQPPATMPANQTVADRPAAPPSGGAGHAPGAGLGQKARSGESAQPHEPGQTAQVAQQAPQPTGEQPASQAFRQVAGREGGQGAGQQEQAQRRQGRLAQGYLELARQAIAQQRTSQDQVAGANLRPLVITLNEVSPEELAKLLEGMQRAEGAATTRRADRALELMERRASTAPATKADR